MKPRIIYGDPTFYTIQQIFDIVTERLLKQARRSTSNGHDCVYRAPDGAKCAAGHLIKDQVYSPEFERRAVPQPHDYMSGLHLKMVDAFECSGVNLYDPTIYALVGDLQRIHDGYPPTLWRRELRRLVFSRKFNLNLNTELTTKLDDTNHQ